MSLSKCTLSWQAFMACGCHVMSTEKEEVMGLLLGRWDGEDGQTSTHVHVDHAMVLTRMDKRPDRVEVAPEQLAMASSIAEHISTHVGQPTRVVGWYHSHPHITVLPSHVDERTQGQYQMMDQRFVGLIFSVFSDDQDKVGKIEVTAFQSVDGNKRAMPDSDVQVQVDPGHGAQAQASTVPRGSPHRNSGPSVTASGPPEWRRKEVELLLYNSSQGSTMPVADALARVVQLQDILFKEERTAYLLALKRNEALTDEEDGGARSSGVMSNLYCSAVYQKSLSSLMGVSTVPLIDTLRSHLANLQQQACSLREKNHGAMTNMTSSQVLQAKQLQEERRSLRVHCSAAGLHEVADGPVEVAPIPRTVALQRAGHGTKGTRLWRDNLRLKGTPATWRVFRDSAQSGGKWVLDMDGEQHTLTGMKTLDTHAGDSFHLEFEILEGGKLDFLCDDAASFAMWESVADALFPQS